MSDELQRRCLNRLCHSEPSEGPVIVGQTHTSVVRLGSDARSFAVCAAQDNNLAELLPKKLMPSAAATREARYVYFLRELH